MGCEGAGFEGLGGVGGVTGVGLGGVGLGGVGFGGAGLWGVGLGRVTFGGSGLVMGFLSSGPAEAQAKAQTRPHAPIRRRHEKGVRFIRSPKGG